MCLEGAQDGEGRIGIQGFFGPAMVGYEELEYGGIVDTLKELDARFKVRQEAPVKS